MKKRITALAASLLLALSIGGCSVPGVRPAEQPEQDQSAEGRVLNIYCWNYEFKNRVEAYYPAYDDATHTINGIKVRWTIIPNENNAYQSALDEALLCRDTDRPDEWVDIFLIEADYAKKYTEQPGAAMDVLDVGLTEDDLRQQFNYTRDVVTGDDGAQRAVSWQACPGVMLYRRDIAKEVFGTDDPDVIQDLVSDWDRFDAAAAAVHARGYRMLGSYDDSYRVFSMNASAPWVSGGKEIVVDDKMWDWVDQTERYTRLGYNEKCSLWSDLWTKGAASGVFCYFGPAWFIDYKLKDNTGAEDGWAACVGPESFFWGGSWICACEGTDNSEIIADIMRALCSSEQTAMALAADVNDFANNRAAMEKLAKDPDYGSRFLCGQNIYGLMCDAAENIVMDKCTIYDQTLNEKFQNSFHLYFDGTASREEALETFVELARDRYPELWYAS